MVRTQVQLTEKQSRALRKIAAQEGVSIAEIIRRAVDIVVDKEYLPDREELKRRALAAVGTVHVDIKDLSTRHDEYLAEDFSK